MGDGVEHDAFSSVIEQSGTLSWTHTPAGTPSGVLVFVVRVDEDSTNNISGVTYGGVAVPLVTGTVAQDTGGEPGLCAAYFLGSGVPTGAQTVQVVTTAGSYTAGAITVASVGDTGVTGAVLLEEDGTLTEQFVDDNSPGSVSVRYAAGWTGLASPPSVGSHSTSLLSNDLGKYGAVVCRETTPGQGSREVGFVSGLTDDRAFVHLAVYEVIS